MHSWWCINKNVGSFNAKHHAHKYKQPNQIKLCSFVAFGSIMCLAIFIFNFRAKYALGQMFNMLWHERITYVPALFSFFLLALTCWLYFCSAPNQTVERIKYSTFSFYLKKKNDDNDDERERKRAEQIMSYGVIELMLLMLSKHATHAYARWRFEPNWLKHVWLDIFNFFFLFNNFICIIVVIINSINLLVQNFFFPENASLSIFKANFSSNSNFNFQIDKIPRTFYCSP